MRGVPWLVLAAALEGVSARRNRQCFDATYNFDTVNPFEYGSIEKSYCEYWISKDGCTPYRGASAWTVTNGYKHPWIPTWDHSHDTPTPGYIRFYMYFDGDHDRTYLELYYWPDDAVATGDADADAKNFDKSAIELTFNQQSFAYNSTSGKYDIPSVPYLQVPGNPSVHMPIFKSKTWLKVELWLEWKDLPRRTAWAERSSFSVVVTDPSSGERYSADKILLPEDMYYLHKLSYRGSGVRMDELYLKCAKTVYDYPTTYPTSSPTTLPPTISADTSRMRPAMRTQGQVRLTPKGVSLAEVCKGSCVEVAKNLAKSLLVSFGAAMYNTSKELAEKNNWGYFYPPDDIYERVDRVTVSHVCLIPEDQAKVTVDNMTDAGVCEKVDQAETQRHEKAGNYRQGLPITAVPLARHAGTLAEGKTVGVYTVDTTVADVESLVQRAVPTVAGAVSVISDSIETLGSSPTPVPTLAPTRVPPGDDGGSSPVVPILLSIAGLGVVGLVAFIMVKSRRNAKRTQQGDYGLADELKPRGSDELKQVEEAA
eukprot:Hpha_TRINITY_DN15878_c1_g7::TRINITY_DN15878_c1_g7_i1::g.191552::m.191552